MYFQLKLKQFTKHFDGKINTVKLGFKELFGHHKRVPYCKHSTIVPKGMKNQEKWLSFGFNTIINKKYQLNGPSYNNLEKNLHLFSSDCKFQGLFLV